MSTQQDLASRTYIRWNADGVEAPQAGEQLAIQAVQNMMKGVQEFMHKTHNHAYTGS